MRNDVDRESAWKRARHQRSFIELVDRSQPNRIFVYVVESISGPKCPFFLRQYLVQVLCFPLLFLKNLFLAGRMIVFQKCQRLCLNLAQRWRQYLVQLSCATCLEQILTQPWTSYWLTFWDNFGSIFFCWNHYCCSVFSKNMLKAHPPPLKNWNTICEHTCANWTNILFSFSVVFLCFYCVLFSDLFLARDEKTQKYNSSKNNKKEPDNKIQASKQSSLFVIRKRQRTHKTF